MENKYYYYIIRQYKPSLKPLIYCVNSLYLKYDKVLIFSYLPRRFVFLFRLFIVIKYVTIVFTIISRFMTTRARYQIHFEFLL